MLQVWLSLITTCFPIVYSNFRVDQYNSLRKRETHHFFSSTQFFKGRKSLIKYFSNKNCWLHQKKMQTKDGEQTAKRRGSKLATNNSLPENNSGLALWKWPDRTLYVLDMRSCKARHCMTYEFNKRKWRCKFLGHPSFGFLSGWSYLLLHMLATTRK